MRTRQPSGKDISPDLPVFNLPDDNFIQSSLQQSLWLPIPTSDDEIRGQTGQKRDVAACFHAQFIEFGFRRSPFG